jgi:hypothetical protein
VHFRLEVAGPQRQHELVREAEVDAAEHRLVAVGAVHAVQVDDAGEAL